MEYRPVPNDETTEQRESAPRAGSPVSVAEWFAVLFALLFPTLITFVYFIAAKENPSVQKIAYAIGKTIQFAFPILFAALVLRQTVRPKPFTVRGMGVGLAFGAAVFAAAVIGWYCGAGTIFAGIAESLRANLAPRLEGFGLLSRRGYCLMAIFYCVIHSGLEEYYWRWFAFGQLRELLRPAAAALVASVGFSLHHAIVLGDYFGFASPWTRLGTLAVFFGGFFWCRLYDKSGSILAPWLSHALIDGAIFFIGYKALFP